MNQSTRYFIFVALFAVAGFGVYTLMNKNVSSDNSLNTAEVKESAITGELVAEANAPKQEEVMGEEAETAEEGQDAQEEVKIDENNVEEVQDEQAEEDVK